jgi:hypothetical protein
MPNTLQFTADGAHHEAHVQLGIERRIRARLLEGHEALVKTIGKEAADKVWKDSDRLFRIAEREHGQFHGREI